MVVKMGSMHYKSESLTFSADALGYVQSYGHHLTLPHCTVLYCTVLLSLCHDFSASHRPAIDPNRQLSLRLRRES
jgi:hypothetical protein